MGGAPAPTAAQDAAASTAPVPAALSSSPSPSSSNASSPGATPAPASLAKPKRPSTATAEAAAASQSDGSAAAPPPQKQQEEEDPKATAATAAAPMVVEVDGDDEGEPPAVEGPCRVAGCGKVTPYRCKSCGEAFYCSRAHQRADWVTEPRRPDGTWGGHHTECVERAWLPAAPVSPLPPPPTPPKHQHQQEQQQEQEGKADEEVLLWSSSNVGGEEGNAAKRTKVADERDGAAFGGNPQALWATGQPAPGTDAATALAMQTPGFWKEGGGDGGDGGATTQPSRGDGYFNKSFEDAILGGALEGMGMSGGPISPLPLGGFDDPSLPAAIHPVGFEDPGAVGMAGGRPVTASAPPAEEAVMQLMEMGFCEADARSALVVHANDVSRALDYLLNTGGGGAGEPPPFDSEAMASAMALAQLGSGGAPPPVPGEWVMGPP